MPTTSQSPNTAQTEDKPLVKLTDGAIAEVKRLIKDKQVPEDHGLRIGVKGGGCAGFSYILGFDRPGENDRTFEIAGISIFVDRAHAMYLLGIEIDYQDGLNNRGFAFNNPNASDTCGCGSSFAT